MYNQGQDLLKHDPQAQKLRRQKIQIVFQNPYGSLNPRKKVGQILEEPLLINTSLSKEQRREKALSMMAKVGLKFQNPYGSLNPRKKVGQILEEPLLINTSLSKEQRREKALSMMAKVGLKTEHYDRYPHMFSGGQRQRIAIARGLMLDPDVVIADEPVSALDVSVRAQVLNLMMDLQQELGLSYVFISHDLSVVEHIADEVMVMYLGRCVEKGTKEQIFNNPRHPYTQALLSATPRLNPDDRRERIKLTGELPSPLNPPHVSVRAQVLNLMMDLQQELGLSYVFISHDLSVVEHIADEVMVMYLGRCVEKGTKEQIFNNPRHPYTQALLSATPRLNPDDRRERIKLTGELPSPLNPPRGCAFNARCRRRFGPCIQLQPQL